MPVVIEDVETPVDNDTHAQPSLPPIPSIGEENLPQRARPAAAATLPLVGVYPALVTEVRDPEGQGRVKVTFPWLRDSDEGELEAWARVATLTAGMDKGTWFLPDVDDEVLVAFEAGNPRRPYVVGALWNGRDEPPEEMDDYGHNDVKLIKSKNGAEIRIDDQSDKGGARIELRTSSDRKIVVDDDARKITISDNLGNEVELSNAGIRVDATGAVEINASQLRVSVGMVTVDAGMSKFTGVVQCDTLITNSVVAASYTPGAGNVW